MIQVAYVSRSAEPMSDQALLDLLLQCRKNNRKRGITGMLLYANGTFLQAIEGEEEVINALVEEIWNDERHTDIQLLHRREIEVREYGDWSMGFERVTDADLRQVEGLHDFGAKDFNFDYLVGNQPTVESLIRHYREPHWDQMLCEMAAKDKVIEHLNSALAQLRERAQIARLALEGVTDAARKGESPEAILKVCEAAMASLRQN
ncbi:MAG: BLUF domain-containing protein [Xanthomonadales bacterium]|nr:BLUF domain-containing protein [Xanthomonadales bacterium]